MKKRTKQQLSLVLCMLLTVTTLFRLAAPAFAASISLDGTCENGKVVSIYSTKNYNLQ